MAFRFLFFLMMTSATISLDAMTATSKLLDVSPQVRQSSTKKYIRPALHLSSMLNKGEVTECALLLGAAALATVKSNFVLPLIAGINTLSYMSGNKQKRDTSRAFGFTHQDIMHATACALLAKGFHYAIAYVKTYGRSTHFEKLSLPNLVSYQNAAIIVATAIIGLAQQKRSIILNPEPIAPSLRDQISNLMTCNLDFPSLHRALSTELMVPRAKAQSLIAFMYPILEVEYMAQKEVDKPRAGFIVTDCINTVFKPTEMSQDSLCDVSQIYREIVTTLDIRPYA